MTKKVEFQHQYIYNTTKDYQTNTDIGRYGGLSMKEWYVGVDGGGTKTDFAVSKQDGLLQATIQRGSCSYQALGIDEAVNTITEGVATCLKAASVLPEECAGCCRR